MIAVDTTVLIDEFRAHGDPAAPVNRALLDHGAEELVVSVVAAGEFLEGAAFLSEERMQEALAILRPRRILPVTLATAEHYARITSALRRTDRLQTRSANDLWIAASAAEFGARLLTRNRRHFEVVPGIRVIGYR